MNTIVDLRVYSAVSKLEIEKSAYRSIIYCFKGEAAINFGGNEIRIKEAEYLLTDGCLITIKDGNDLSIAVVYLKDSVFPFVGCQKFVDENERPVSFCLVRAEEYFFSNDFKRRSILDALGNLVVGYVCYALDKQAGCDVCERIKTALNENISEASFKISAFLQTLPLSADYVKKLFKKQYGLTPHDYLIKLRLEKAKIMLSSADRFDYTIKKVSAACGFSDPLYFSRLFKKNFKLSPLAYSHRFDKPIKKKKVPVGGIFEDDV